MPGAGSFREGVHRAALRVYRRLPTRARRTVVRTLSPSYTVGAMCLIERADGEVLLVRQTYRNHWGLPGGLLERGENPAEAAAREVLEEVGLQIEVLGQPAVVVDPDPQRVDLVYRARPRSMHDVASVAPRSPEVTDARWFTPESLPELQSETAQALVALARSSRHPQAPPLLPPMAWVDRL